MEPTYFYIYEITNLINGKIYVGAHATSNLDDGYMGSGLILLRAIKKYGVTNFRKDILSWHSSYENLFEEERRVVNTEFIKRSDTYNLTEGGKGWDSNNSKKYAKIGGIKAHTLKLGIHGLSQEQVLQRTIKKRELKNCPFFNKEMREEFTLRAFSAEGRKKHAQALKRIQHQQGSKNSQFGKIWITNGIINQKIKKEDEIPEGFWKGRKV